MVNENKTKQQSYRIVMDEDLTIYSVLALKDKLLAGLSTTEDLELDLSAVSEIDGAGLQLLVMVKKEAVALGKVLSFTGHSPVVLELVDLSGLAGFFGDPLLIVHKHAN